MKHLLYTLILVPSILFGQAHVQEVLKLELAQTNWDKKKKEWKPFEDFDRKFKKAIKFATFYGAFNGNNSIADIDEYSISTGQLITNTEKTPFDYSIVLGVRKIARFGYENRANVFYNGTEHSYADAATIGKYLDLNFYLKQIINVDLDKHI